MLFLNGSRGRWSWEGSFYQFMVGFEATWFYYALHLGFLTIACHRNGDRYRMEVE